MELKIEMRRVNIYEIMNFFGFQNLADYTRAIFLGNGGMIYNHLVVAPLIIHVVINGNRKLNKLLFGI